MNYLKLLAGRRFFLKAFAFGAVATRPIYSVLENAALKSLGLDDLPSGFSGVLDIEASGPNSSFLILDLPRR